ncbi:hypothetical protein AU193_04485 [Mycobacterium sp. GA-1285]|uniref:hypothetical protein n=1 Tax=Mycobacterium sp. GA-1285 TaxID=1772282 RepID=UPI00074AC4D3|nr:hypothetical protein [Mycobacterium sp. GA-1285]KUI13002.1 hypothetical protein AU193_04485 [Mycobacterium sp. GA-1285]
MQFSNGVTWRISKRGLVVCVPGGSSLLVEHERAAELPLLIADASDADELIEMLGGTDADAQLVDVLLSEEILSEGFNPVVVAESGAAKRVTFSRSGIEFTGIDAVARAVHRLVWPVVRSWPGRVAIGAIVLAGIVSFVIGRPDGPQVSDHPWVDATVGLILGFALVGLHELGHAVVLVHYGRSPRVAGCGFYWGALCFYVDCSDGTTLPRRARIINALAGLAVDVVTLSVLLVLSHGFASSVLISSVCWRIAIMQLIGILENGLPILEVDGHVALADYLDEPDLSPRAREALSRKLRRIKHNDNPSWLAAYGAFSILGGIVLLIGSTWVWWLAAGDLTMSLFSGNLVEMLLGLYIVIPVALAAAFSGIGLLQELISKSSSGK